MFRAIATLVAGGFLLAACVYPYEGAYQACDAQAGACYQQCEGAPDENGLQECHLICEDVANQCFDDAYGATDYAYGGSPWYGSNGYYRPRYGYVYSLNYYDSYGYGYNYPRSRPRSHYRDGDRRHRYRDGDRRHRDHRRDRRYRDRDQRRDHGSGGRDQRDRGDSDGGQRQRPAPQPRAPRTSEPAPEPTARPPRKRERARDGRRIDKD